jgi:hypothetical protein
MSGNEYKYVLVGIAIIGVYFAYKSYQNSQNLQVLYGPSSFTGQVNGFFNTAENDIASIWHNITGVFSGGNGNPAQNVTTN